MNYDESVEIAVTAPACRRVLVRTRQHERATVRGIAGGRSRPWPNAGRAHEGWASRPDAKFSPCKALKTHETGKSSPAPLRKARRGLSRADELGAGAHLTEPSPGR